MTKRVLVACEETQAVTKALRARGVEAYSADIIPCSGGHPEWHLQGDVTPLLQQEWDAVIAFPPCTHLASSGARWWPAKQADGRQQAAEAFFMACYNANAPLVAVENPVGRMSTAFRKPDQIIQPWQFGDEATKTTCLWLRGFGKLTPTKIVGKGDFYILPDGRKMASWYNLPESKERSRLRSKTFPGIAAAMAEQWFPLS